METKTKIIIGVASVLTLGIGGYFIYRSIKNSEKEEEMYNSKKEGDIGYVEPKTTTTVTTPEKAGVPTVNPATTTPSIPTLSTLPSMPNLGGFDLGSFGSTATTAQNEPTAVEYIRMADRWMSWDNIWKFGEKLGIKDKNQIGIPDGTCGNDLNAILNKESRKKFNTEIAAKFPDWKDLLKTKANEHDIPLNSIEQFNNGTKWHKDNCGIEMASFNGSQNNPANFWTSGR